MSSALYTLEKAPLRGCEEGREKEGNYELAHLVDEGVSLETRIAGHIGAGDIASIVLLLNDALGMVGELLVGGGLLGGVGFGEGVSVVGAVADVVVGVSAVSDEVWREMRRIQNGRRRTDF